MRIRLARDAEDDLDQIFTYLKERTVVGAESVGDSLFAMFQRIASFPKIGRQRSELLPDLRSIPCGSYIIYWRQEQDTVWIMHVFHSARDIKKENFQPQ